MKYIFGREMRDLISKKGPLTLENGKREMVDEA